MIAFSATGLKYNHILLWLDKRDYKIKCYLEHRMSFLPQTFWMLRYLSHKLLLVFKLVNN